MAASTSNTSMDDVFSTWINRQFLTDFAFDLQHQKFTAAVVMTDGIGANQAQFVDWAPPLRGSATVGTGGYTNTGSTALTEATPTGNEITNVTTTQTLVPVLEYGEFIKVSKLWEHSAVSGSRERLTKRLKDGAVLSIDTLCRMRAATTSTIFYAIGNDQGGASVPVGGSTTAPATVGNANIAALLSCRKILYDNQVPGIEGVEGHTDGNYAAIITPSQELQITTEVTTGRITWLNCIINVPGMDGQRRFVKGLIGDVYGVSVYRTQNYMTQTLTSACEVGFVYGADGVAAASFEQMQPQVILNDLNSPYKNVNTIAWHAYFGAKLVSSSNSRVIKLYSLS